MRRRKFLALVGGAAAWPVTARAQSPEQIGRVGVLMTTTSSDMEGHARLSAFVQGLRDHGWIERRNLSIETRWTAEVGQTIRTAASEMLSDFRPQVILAPGSATVTPLLEMTKAVPIVFVNVVDPVGAGFVQDLAHPGSNVTGFTQYEYGTTGKWLEFLKQIAPEVTRVGILRDPAQPSGLGQFAAIQSAAPTLNIVVSPIDLRSTQEIERGVAALAHAGKAGLVITGSGSAVVHRDLIVKLAAQHKLPAVYYERFFIADGGLMSYGPNLHEQYRQAASYVDRILKGEKPAGLPVQVATKYQLVINLKTAKTLGLAVSPTLLARADEVIE